MDMAIGVVIETPKESRLKFKLDPATGAYKVDRILPKGLRFPFNFGFIPQTRAPDGDSTDVLLILDEILFPGCAVDCRALGVIHANQSEKGKIYRNDRILAVPLKDPDAQQTLDDLDRHFIADVERFFATYHGAEGNQSRVVGLGDSAEGADLVRRTRFRVDEPNGRQHGG